MRNYVSGVVVSWERGTYHCWHPYVWCVEKETTDEVTNFFLALSHTQRVNSIPVETNCPGLVE